MFQKTQAYFSLVLAFFITAMVLVFPPVPQFDYDFEQFFPQDNADLEFYGVYKSKFENDNDYLLIALENPKGQLIDKNFLDKSLLIQNEINSLHAVDTVISILNFEKPIIGVFGMRWEKVFKWETELDRRKSEMELESYRSQLVSSDKKSLLFWIKNKQNISKEEGDELYLEIRSVFNETDLQPKAVAGKIQAQGDFIQLMQKEFGMFFGLSILLILLMLFLIFRSFWAVWIPVVTLLIGVIWAFAFMWYFGKSLDVMSVMQPTIFLIVGLSALVHFITHLKTKIDNGLSQQKAIVEVFKDLLIPVGLTFLTTSLGFISLYFTTIPALKSFGLTTGIGVMIIFAVCVLVTPGLLYLVPIRVKERSRNQHSKNSLSTFFIWILSRRKTVLFTFGAISILSVWAGSSIQVNGFLLDNLPSDHPIQNDLDYFDQQFGGSNPLELYLEVGEDAGSLLDYEVLQELEKVEIELQKLLDSAHLISPLTLVKSLNQAQNQGSAKAFAFPSQGQYQRMKRFLDRDLGEVGTKVLVDQKKAGRISSRIPDFGTVKMTEIRTRLNEFVQNEIDPNLLKVSWTGTAYLIDLGHQSVTSQMAKGLGFAFLIVGIIAGVLFRSWRISFILLVPNVIPLIWMLGLMYLLGVEFKLTTAILFTVAFGIAVDDSIHFMTRLRFELSRGLSLVYAIKRTFLETGKAIILTSVILVSGFGLLIFSQFGVTHFTGLLIGASLIFALLADLLLLPLLLLPMKKVWEEKSKRLNLISNERKM
ncbi:MMPL family transporter [Algoriphagus aestuarii]|nr:MMPL family transporter [Algoriphagus aestuarii]